MDRRLFLGSAAAAAFAPAVARAKTGFAITKSDVGLLMPASVKGHATRAIFDCGTSQCAIDTKLAQSLGIAVAKTFRAGAAYDDFQAGRTDPVDLVIGDRAFRRPLIVMPLDTIGEGVGMLIGRDVLSDACLDLDVPGGRASFQTTRPAPSMTPIAMIQGKQGDLAVQVQVEGFAAQASLDSGCTVAMMIANDWFDRQGLARDHRLIPWIGDDLSGEASIAMTDLKAFGFGGAELHDVPVEVSHTRLAYEVNLGLPVLERFHSFWDLANEKLWLSAGDVAGPFEHERAGIACARVGNVLKVVFVVPDSPAAQTGFKADDEITKIDGRPIAVMSDAASLAWKNDPSRPSVTLTMGSGESRRLALKDYF
jgi:predicted aspartyl protease